MVKSPRFLRPHIVTYVKILGESDSGIQMFDTFDIGLVKAEVVHNSSKSNIGVENADSLLVTIDMNDYECDLELAVNSQHTEDVSFNDNGMLLICIGDKILFNRTEYEIESITPVAPIRYAPEFLEIRAK